MDTMNDKTNETREAETPHKKVTLTHWDRVGWVMPRIADASREPTCMEWVIGVTLANAIAVVNAPFCAGDKDELAELDIRRVITIIAERTHAGMMDDIILLLREVLKHCITRGDSSIFTVDAEAETTKP